MIVYILYSKKLNRFYTGQTKLSIEERLKQHNESFFENSFSKKGIPWIVFLTMECTNRIHALKVEQHIKRMKSKAYIQNLKKYPEMQDKLIQRFKD